MALLRSPSDAKATITSPFVYGNFYDSFVGEIVYEIDQMRLQGKLSRPEEFGITQKKLHQAEKLMQFSRDTFLKELLILTSYRILYQDMKKDREYEETCELILNKCKEYAAFDPVSIYKVLSKLYASQRKYFLKKLQHDAAIEVCAKEIACMEHLLDLTGERSFFDRAVGLRKEHFAACKTFGKSTTQIAEHVFATKKERTLFVAQKSPTLSSEPVESSQPLSAGERKEVFEFLQGTPRSKAEDIFVLAEASLDLNNFEDVINCCEKILNLPQKEFHERAYLFRCFSLLSLSVPNKTNIQKDLDILNKKYQCPVAKTLQGFLSFINDQFEEAYKMILCGLRAENLADYNSFKYHLFPVVKILIYCENKNSKSDDSIAKPKPNKYELVINAEELQSEGLKTGNRKKLYEAIECYSRALVKEVTAVYNLEHDRITSVACTKILFARGLAYLYLGKLPEAQDNFDFAIWIARTQFKCNLNRSDVDGLYECYFNLLQFYWQRSIVYLQIGNTKDSKICIDHFFKLRKSYTTLFAIPKGSMKTPLQEGFLQNIREHLSRGDLQASVHCAAKVFCFHSLSRIDDKSDAELTEVVNSVYNFAIDYFSQHRVMSLPKESPKKREVKSEGRSPASSPKPLELLPSVELTKQFEAKKLARLEQEKIARDQKKAQKKQASVLAKELEKKKKEEAEMLLKQKKAKKKEERANRRWNEFAANEASVKSLTSLAEVKSVPATNYLIREVKKHHEIDMLREEIVLPLVAVEYICKLKKAGASLVFVVGGIVRSALLGEDVRTAYKGHKQIIDIDLVTDASTEQISSAFKESNVALSENVRGLYSIKLNSKADKVIYRIQIKQSHYLNQVNPLVHDALSRDLYQNAAYADELGQVYIPLHKTITALTSRVSDAIDKPEIEEKSAARRAFKDDPKRMLRAIVQSFSFPLSSEIKDAIPDTLQLIRDRCRDEKEGAPYARIINIFLSEKVFALAKTPALFQLLHQNKVIATLFPVFPVEIPALFNGILLRLSSLEEIYIFMILFEKNRFDAIEKLPGEKYERDEAIDELVTEAMKTIPGNPFYKMCFEDFTVRAREKDLRPIFCKNINVLSSLIARNRMEVTVSVKGYSLFAEKPGLVRSAVVQRLDP